MTAVIEIFEDAGEVLETVGKTVVRTVDFVVDKIVAPVAQVMGTVIQSAIDDPIKTVAQVAAIATQQYWALPLIEGADVAIAGGDLTDVAEATAKAYIMQEVGSYVGQAAGQYAGEAAAGAQYGTSGNQAAMLAAQEAGLGTSAAIASEIVGAAAGAAAVSVVAGKDPVEAFLSGGIGAAVPAILGQVSGFKELPNAVQRVISSGVSSQLSTQNVTAATINAAIAASGIVTDILNTFDPATNSEGKSIPDAQRKLDGAQRAILTDILMGTATTALVGGKPEDVVRNALVKSGSKALGEAVTDSFKTTVNGVTTSYKDLSKTVADIETNETSQRTAASNYNATVKKIQDRQTEANRLLGLRNTAVETYNTNKTQESYDAAQLATKTYNEYVLAFNTDYQNTFKPDLTKYGGELDALKRSHAALSGNYESLREGFIAKTDQITPVLDPIYGRTNAAMVETLRPDFNPTEYAAVNGLADNVDPYEHFLREGQYKGLPVNQDNAQALAQGGVKTTAIDKTPTTGVKPEDIFDGTNYDSKAAAQKAAVSLGRSYFTAPDGQTYKILSESEVKDKIKGASSFGEAFSMARQTLGSGATFEWTNPTTGKTSSFNTQTQEERAAAANKLSLAGGVSQAQAASADGAAPTVGVPKEVTDYVSDKIIKNITDYDNYNPADLTKAEYARFINTYLNATEATRAELLKGTFGDSKTYGVIDSVLKQAPAAIRAASEAQVTVIPPGAISVSDYTNYAGVAKAAVTTVVNDTAGVLTRGFQLLGTALGMDTPTLDEAQKAWTENKDKAFSKLVGNEKVIGMGLASGIESIGSFVIGGPVGSVLSLSAITANNSWIEGTTAVIDRDGNTWSSEKEANANGKWEVRKLTPAENAYRTAAMTTLELAFETLGIPGMKQLVKGVPIGQGNAAFVDGIKRAAVGMGSEQLTEFATTTAQFLVDKFSSFGLTPNATLADYAQAVQDTILATAVAVGTSGSIATGIQNLQNATIFVRERTAYEPMSYNTVVAETPQGERVTLAELITAQSVSDLSDPSTLAEFANLKPLVSVNAVLELGTQQVRLGDILTGAVDFAKTTAELTPSAVAEIMRQGNFIPDDNAVAQFAGKLASNITFQDINTYIDNNKVDLNEVKQIAQDQGLTLTDAQAQKYVQQGNQEVIKEQLAKELTPAAFFTKQLNDAITQITTQSDAQDNLRFDAIDTAIRNLRDSGLTPTQVQNIVGTQLAPLTSQIQSIQSVVGKETGGNLPSSADLQAALETSLGKRAYDKKYDWDGDGKVTAADVSDLVKVSLGRPSTMPMAEGLPWNQPTGLYKAIADAKTNLQAALTAAQRGDITRFDNIDAAIKNLKDSGLTTEQVQRLVSDSATGMSTKFQTALDEAVKGNTKELGAVKTALTTQLTTLQTSVAEFQKGNTARFDSLDLAIKGLKDAGLTTEQVQNIVDTASTSLSKTFRTALDEAAKGNTKAIADAVKGLATKTDIETAIANIKFPPGLSKTDVTDAITDYMAKNPGLNAKDVADAIASYMKDNPPLTKTDVSSAITSATKNFATKTDIETAIANIKFPAGLSKADVSAAITDYMAKNPGLSLADVATKITEATAGLATSAGVKTEIANALSGYATKSDIETAIANIKFPAGISKEDVSAAISKYMKDNPGLSLADVATKITEATAGLATSAGVKTEIANALTGYATKNDIDTAIANIKFPAGLTKEDVSSAITDYMAKNPGLSTKDVANTIATYMKDNPPVTKADISSAITAATAGFATKTDIETAIANIKFPAGISQADVTQAITDYMAKNPGLQTKDVAAAIATYMKDNPPLTKTDVSSAITNATAGFATKSDIDTAIANIKFPAGLSKEDVSAAITKYMTDNPGLTLAEVATKITEATAGLATSEGVKTDIANALTGYATKSDIETAIANIKFPAGLSKEDVSAAITKYMQDNPGLNAADVTKVITDYMAANPPLNKDDVTSIVKTAGDSLKSDLTQTENKILAEVAKNEAAGLKRDAALQKAISDVAATQGKDVAALTKQITESQSALGKEITALTTQIGGVETRLTAAITAARNAGLAGDAALQSAINTVAGNLGTTKEQLLSQLGTTESKLRTDFATQLGVVQQQVGALETTILGRMEQYEKAGIARDQALDRAIGDVATQLGTTRENILTQLGTTEATLRTDIAGAEQRLGARLGELTTLVGTPTQQATQQDLDAIINILQQQGAYDARYDYNGDRIIDEKDRLAVDQYLQSQQTGYAGPAVPFAPAAGTMWAPTGLFGQLAADQAATQKAIADQAEATRAANAAAALRTQRMGNLNTMMGMLSQAPDVAGQQVTVKAADPTKIGYVYDWSSIFANPQQQKMFMSPYGAYAAGGQVKDEMAEVNDELLKILRG